MGQYYISLSIKRAETVTGGFKDIMNTSKDKVFFSVKRIKVLETRVSETKLNWSNVNPIQIDYAFSGILHLEKFNQSFLLFFQQDYHPYIAKAAKEIMNFFGIIKQIL